MFKAVVNNMNCMSNAYYIPLKHFPWLWGKYYFIHFFSHLKR